MWYLLNESFSTERLIPHGYCLQWNPFLLWTLVASDLIIAASYFSIPFAIWYFCKKRSDITQGWLFLLFGLFIIACGTTHFFDVLNIWQPNYWASAVAKVITAVLSLGTAILIWRIMPDALLAPSSQQLTNAKCELENANVELDYKVQERTFELLNVNASLQLTLSKQSALNEDLQRKKALLSGVINNIPDLIFFKDTQSSYLGCNKAFGEYFGATESEIIGKTDFDFVDAEAAKFFRQKDKETLSSNEARINEEWVTYPDGRKVCLDTLKVPFMINQEVHGLIGVSRNVTERKKADETIVKLAFYDSLTHLPNRTLLRDRLNQAMIVSNRDKTFGALLFIDLDDFKRLNDTRGHDVGDLLLKEVAVRLTACVREDDTIARLGGDEFLVVLKSLSESQQEAAELAKSIGTKILVSVNNTYQLEGVDCHITASIGATLFLGEQTSTDELMKQADLAMYKSKEAGRNTLRFFDADMEVSVMKRAALDSELREAIEKKQFTLYYQAQIAGEQVVGAEALVRWQHPQRGVVSPNDFIPLAEESGLILPIGEWVLETACTQLAIWATQPDMAHLTVAVNVSARQFHQSDFVGQVLAILKDAGVNPQRLKLELTESMLVNDMEDIIEKMYALKAKGVTFSLDDFGTGFSSLSYLQHMPLDQLKIDRSFVQGVLTDTNSAAICKTIITLAEGLGLNVIAEGVESPLQRDFLVVSGCYVFQGYFYSRPLSLGQFEEFVQQIQSKKLHN